MFDTKNQRVWPDLSRYIFSIGSQGKRWELEHLCKAYYRFNEWAASGEPGFIDRSGIQDPIMIVTGSATGLASPTYPSVLSYDRTMLPINLNSQKNALAGAPLVNRTPVSLELIPGSQTRVMRPFVMKCFNFENRNRRFLLGNVLKDVDTTFKDKEYTFVTRVCVVSHPEAPGEPEVIFSISEFNIPLLSFQTVIVSGTAYNLNAKIFDASGYTQCTSANLEYDRWYTALISIKGPTTSANGQIKLDVWLMENGSHMGDVVTSISSGKTLISLTSPRLFIGYGDSNSSPNAAFPVGDSNDWGHHARISELAILAEWTSADLNQAIACGWSDDAFLSGVGRLFTNWTSGFDSAKARKALRLMDDSRVAYPSISRTGDGTRLGNEPRAPFNDDNTLIFTGSSVLGPIRFPQMLPQQLFLDGTLTSFSRKGLTYTNQSDLGVDPSIIASGSVRPGIISREAFIFERNDGIFGREKQASDMLESPIAPFDDSARDTSVEIIHLPATPLSTTLGFDQPLGSRIAIVIDLNPAADLVLGHVLRPLTLTGSAGITGGLENRTCIPSFDSPGASINSIAYFNFADGEWEKTGIIADDTLQTDPNYFIASSSLAFAATTGFVVNPDAEEPLLPLMARGRPTDTFGFPFGEKWSPTPSQKLDLSKYLSSPFLLEKMVIKHNIDFYEAGDEGLGYIIKEKKSSQDASFLAYSASAPGAAVPSYARVDVTANAPGGRWTNLVSYNDLFYAGESTADFLTYGRFPVMGGMTGKSADPNELPGLRGGLLIPSDDNMYKVVKNELISLLDRRTTAANSSLYENAVAEEIELTAGQTPGGAAFWRADTFFLLRDTPGKVNRTKDVTPQPAMLNAASRGRWWPSSVGSDAQEVGGWPYTHAEHYKIASVSSSSIRELITYAQIAHCGYVRTDANSQALKSGSTWQETHPTRAGAKFYPHQNSDGGPFTVAQNSRWSPTLDATEWASDNGGRGAWRNADNRGYPHHGMGLNGSGDGLTPQNLGSRAAFWSNLVGLINDFTGVWVFEASDPWPWEIGLEPCWPSPHPFDSKEGTGWFTDEGLAHGSWESHFTNAIYPYQAQYHPLGLNDCIMGVPDGPTEHPLKEFDVQQVANAYPLPVHTSGGHKWCQPFKAQWHSGSRETGGGSFISNPVMFVPESAVLARANNVSNHGAYDFFIYGGFNTPGKLTRKTLLDAGLRRDLTIQISSGDRFVRLLTTDPEPGMLGWCDHPPWTYSLDGGTTVVTVPWEKQRPTSAYLVATASREYPGSGNILPVSTNLRRLNSGAFTIVSDIKNNTKGGAISGTSFRSLFPQHGHVLVDEFNYDAPNNWSWMGNKPTQTYGWNEAFFQRKTLLPVIPPNIMCSVVNFAYPREGGFLHTIDEMSPINPTMRSVGLSSGRSYIRGVVGTIETNQRGWYCPPIISSIPTSAFNAGTGKYGWSGPVGAAHFTQGEEFTTAFGTSDIAFLGQLLPYALGYDTRGWVTCFPNIGQNSAFVEPNQPGVRNAPVFSANHPPFCLGIMQQLSSSYSREYVYNSPYLLFPSDELVFGFQPAIGGGNEGAPRPINTPSGPFSLSDELGYQGIQSNDYSVGTTNIHLPQDYSGDVPDGNPFPSAGGGPPDPTDLGHLCGDAGYRASGGDSTYKQNHRLYKAGNNRVSLSEQIRQTILKAGDAKLILYGTLLRNQKPLSSELNQPLITNAVHEALHYDNPVLDQFQVQQESEYKSSYLTQYITGSLIRGDKWRGVVSTAWDGTLGINAAFNPFVTLVDEAEVYWDSLLPDVFDMWQKDGLQPILDYQSQPDGSEGAAHGAYIFTLTSKWDSAWAPLGTINVHWNRNFPFEPRYHGVERSLIDPAGLTTSGLSDKAVGAAGFWSEPSSGVYPVSWPLNSADGRPGIIAGLSRPSTWFAPGNSETGAPDYSSGACPMASFVRQSRNNTSIGNAAYLYGFSRTQGYYLDCTDPVNSGDSVATEPWKLLGQVNAQFGGMYWIHDGKDYCTPGDSQNLKGRWDHPEGVKYGLKNYVWESTKGTFRSDRYGQFRDMLEQRRYTKIFHKGDVDTERGEKEAAVSCIFVDSDGNPVQDPQTTQCLNISTFMTSSIPYFEGTSKRVIKPSQYITIDINNSAGSSLKDSPIKSTR